jgi:hypothetical protein
MLKGAAPLASGMTAKMMLDDEQLKELSSALGLNISSAAQLVSRVRSMTSFDLDGMQITLEPALLQRLKSRCVGRQDFCEFLSAEITRQLRAFVGM